MFRRNLFLLLILLLFGSCSAYLPGLYPINYCSEQTAIASCRNIIPVLYNSLVSKKAIIPIKYSYLDLCVDEKAVAPAENLGQLLFGEKHEVSGISLKFLKNEECSLACKKNYDSKGLAKLYSAIKNGYKHRITIDDLPAEIQYSTFNEKKKMFKPYIPLGCYSDNPKKGDLCQYYITSMDMNQAYLFNHVKFTINYHRISDGEGRIVFILVEPQSIEQTSDNLMCVNERLLIIPKESQNGMEISFTYSVEYVQNDKIAWSSRWDYLLLSSYKSKIQWLSIVNSMVIVIFLAGLVAFIFVRTLRRDISRYNELVNGTDSQEDFGWKLIHGDIFRAPNCSMLLCVFTGFGLQLVCMTLFTLFIALVAFSSPAYRGTLLTTGMVIFVLLGSVAGYTSARLYKFMGGTRWKLNVLLTSTLCPAIIFVIFFIINITLAAAASAAATSFTTILSLVALWLFVSLPLCYLGAFFGFRADVITVPVRTNQIPRQIPKPISCIKYFATVLLSGSLPFGCIFVQLFIIFSSIWGNEINYMFGFLFLIFLITIVTCSLTSILIIYLQLCTEDYRWWWKSFFSVGTSSICVFINAIHFYLTKLQYHDSTSTFLYFGYITIISFLFFLLTGTIGLLSSFWFVRKIYSAVKVD